METFGVGLVLAQEENLVLPIALELIDQVLNFESYARLNTIVCSLLKHRLQETLEVVKSDHGVLSSVLLLRLSFGSVLLIPCCGLLSGLRRSRWLCLSIWVVHFFLSRLT